MDEFWYRGTWPDQYGNIVTADSSPPFVGREEAEKATEFCIFPDGPYGEIVLCEKTDWVQLSTRVATEEWVQDMVGNAMQEDY